MAHEIPGLRVEQSVLQGEIGHHLLQGGCLTPQVFDFIRRCSPHRVAGQPFLAGFKEVLRPTVIEVLDDPFAAAELGDALLAAQALQHDADLIFCRKMSPRRPANVLHDLFRRLSIRPGFPLIFAPSKGYDEPEISLPQSANSVSQALTPDTVIPQRCGRFASQDSTPCARRKIQAAAAKEPATTTTKLSHVSVVEAGIKPETKVKPSPIFQEDEWAGEGQSSCCLGVVALCNQKLLKWHKACKRKEHAYAGRYGRRYRATDEEHPYERAGGDARQKNSGHPFGKFDEEKWHADMRDIHQHHRDERQVVTNGKCKENELLLRRARRFFRQGP